MRKISVACNPVFFGIAAALFTKNIMIVPIRRGLTFKQLLKLFDINSFQNS